MPTEIFKIPAKTEPSVFAGPGKYKTFQMISKQQSTSVKSFYVKKRKVKQF